MSKAIWIFRLIPALILFQTLFFKFSAAPESVYIFEKTGLGDIGRIGSGVVELICVVLLLWPKMTKWGSILTSFVMFGAIGSHLNTLGIEVQGDGGLLFYLACTTLVFSILNFLLTDRSKP